VLTQQRQLTSGGVTRQYLLTIPDGYNPAVPTPLVLNFHGLGSDAIQQAVYTQLDQRAKTRGFIVATPNGIESTVVDVSSPSPALLRHGGVTQEDIEVVIGKLAPAAPSATPKSPGQLESHYAPTLPLRLDISDVKPDEALLAFGPEIPSGARTTANLSPSGDLVEAAANLFAMLRRLDGSGSRAIAVTPIPDTGLGRAINDRLRRAATR
jgi:hypothetical protein